ncbi:MAG: cytochrome oxidase subunit III [Chloroflexi bacterium]|nr:cytochrome oxidase subunit III [Chloroflexota bacterium]MCH2308747.1 heme-copper oxidase subunit III [SAR202 cluster bacterium]MQG05409.1 heme-copper oxidase subunit III [SAR202 cluster bacterium]GIT16067.1 MAG: cytochrome o ubiquinol oxidase subunit III [Chloroflexota bacterium]|tara:strand:+ start:629 stop:1246 length:618 start_codon:yes stop_codon:yes gene_type:complete
MANLNTTHSEHEEHTTTGLNNRKMLMWAFLGSDCMFFAALIATYVIYSGQIVGGGPVPEDVFSIPVTSVSTFVLLMSSMSMVLAYSALVRGQIKNFQIWILSTAFLGMTFIGFQVFEFRDFVLHGLTPKTNLFGSTFFVLTGFHGAHVTLGIIWLLSLYFFSLRGGVTPERHLDVDLAALYWHFVDVVWIVIFTVVYLLGVFPGI